MSEPSPSEVFKALLKRDALKKMVNESLSGLSDNGRAAVLSSRGLCIAQTLARGTDKEQSDLARNLFIQEYELLDATRPDDEWAIKVKKEFMAFANYCIVSMPPDPSIEQQRAVWTEALRKWEKSIPVWEGIWATWLGTFPPLPEGTDPRKEFLATIG
ncbi:unnamed protein product [Peniophora sp. CBMAI 1063]|nr:unnamed protein product [Peniophora sp. CBMAI 1063]